MLKFVYEDAQGACSTRAVEHWQEVGRYIQGNCARAGTYKTFRKDRIVEYLDGGAEQLADPHPPPPPSIKDDRPQVLFTGFARVQRSALESKADAAGMRVMKTVSRDLDFLCAGPNAGPTKVEQSRAQGVYIVSEAQLHALLADGELPDEGGPEAL